MTSEIERLRSKRALYERLGKRKKVAMIDAKLVPMVTSQIKNETLAEQVRRDIEWIGTGRAA